MSVEENRNCNCEEENTVDCDLRRKMIQEIRGYDFAITELALYLDTHPDDACAVNMYNSFTKQLNEAIRNYECKYGPLTNFGYGKSGCPWQWVEQPWPWDREFNC